MEYLWWIFWIIVVVIYLKVRLHLLDAYLLLRLAFGSGGSSGRLARSRLHLYVAETSFLDWSSNMEIEVLMREAFNVEESLKPKGLQYMQDALLKYKLVALCRDQIDGSLRGMIALDEKAVTFDGNDIVLITCGMWLVQPKYRGSILPVLFGVSRCLRHFFINPGKPVYVVGKMFSHKAYASIAHNAEVYPRYDRETPPLEQAIIDRCGVTMSSAEKPYSAESGVIESTTVALESHDTAVTEQEKHKDPHVAFFVERNPKYMEGSCLIILYKVTPSVVATTIWTMVQRVFSLGSRGKRFKKGPGGAHVQRAKSVSDFVQPRRQRTGERADGKRFSDFFATLPEDAHYDIGESANEDPDMNAADTDQLAGQ